MKKLSAGFATLLILVIIGLIVGIGITFAYFQLKSKPAPQPQQTTTSQSTSTPAPATKSTPTTDETTNWKTYETGKFSIKYPPSWALTNFRFAPTNDESSVTFYSPDYEDDGGFPYVTKGFKILLTVADKGLGYQLIDPNTAGVVGITETTWLGKKAQLVKITYEGANVRLETVETPKDLSLVMFPPVSETPRFKTFEENKKDFIAVANSLKLK